MQNKRSWPSVSPESQRKEDRVVLKNNSEEIIAEHFPRVLENINLHTQEVQQTSSRINSKEIYAESIIKLLKTDDKVRMLQKQQIKRYPFPTREQQPEGLRDSPQSHGTRGRDFLNILKGKSLRPAFCNREKTLQKRRHNRDIFR